MRANRFAAMINALTFDEIASISQADLLILRQGLKTMDRSRKSWRRSVGSWTRLMGEDRMRGRWEIVLN